MNDDDLIKKKKQLKNTVSKAKIRFKQGKNVYNSLMRAEVRYNLFIDYLRTEHKQLFLKLRLRGAKI